ncbi:zinc finger and SCAN domain-containing protein 29-like [Pseudomyrmex gracilis]|uniref:zinc finger and SCAN domain-containing protein 29-like n=1 Tax=Pseudomyrmex gracilis TaxID=219809 RepID=UPI0009954C89|nr:zinc finger and SCAN domain-containing protein 29-like [Pseudomyrmex gracilis]
MSSDIEIDLARYLIIKDQNKVAITENGCLLLWDKVENTTVEVEDIPQIRQYFGVELEKSACKDDTNVVSIQTCDEKKATAFWKDENTVKTFTYQSKQHQYLFESSVIRNDVVWTKISKELKKVNSAWQYTAKNCENKFKDITKTYKRIKDHNNQTGVEPKTCKYFEELDEVLGEKPCLKPVALASNLKKRSHSARSLSSVSSNADNTISDIDDVTDSESKSKKPKKTRMERELELWTKTISEENRKRDEMKEQRHQELLACQNRARKTYEHFMTKLLEKF